MTRDNRFGLGQCLTFCLQVERQIPVRRVDAGVSKPVGDGTEVHAGSKQVDCGAVSHTMRMKPFTLERGEMLGRRVYVFLQDQTHAKAGERLAAVIAEDTLLFVQGDLTFREVPTQSAGGFRP